jgi:hypothetical protein
MHPQKWEFTHMIPDERWQPLSLAETVDLFTGAPFAWALGGGYCVEQFVGAPYRDHDDVDVVIFRDEQLAAQRWLPGWVLYASDPPGTHRLWNVGEYLPFGIHDIWGYREGKAAWEFQFMVAEAEGEGEDAEWFSRRDPRIRGKRGDLFTVYNSLPCVRIELQLFYKSRGLRPKDQLDFSQCLPLLSAEQKAWLAHSIRLMNPNGHVWLARLEEE